MTNRLFTKELALSLDLNQGNILVKLSSITKGKLFLLTQFILLLNLRNDIENTKLSNT